MINNEHIILNSYNIFIIKSSYYIVGFYHTMSSEDPTIEITCYKYGLGLSPILPKHQLSAPLTRCLYELVKALPKQLAHGVLSLD